MNSFPPELLRMILGAVDDPKTLMVVVPNVCKAWKEACVYLQVHLNFTWGKISPSAFLWVCRRFPAADRITCRAAMYGVVAGGTHCHGLRSVDLSFCTSVGDNAMRALSRCAKLEVASLRGCRRLTNHGIKMLAKGCGRLVDINVTRCYMLGNASLMALGEHCSGLTAIDFSWCALVSDAGVAAVAVGCKRLERVNFDRCFQLRDPAPLGLHCPFLQRAWFHNCTRLTDAGTVAMARGCKRLTNLDFGSCNMLTDAAMLMVAANCLNLTHINVRGCRKLTDVGVGALGACPNLV
jgi:hypothetical protein